MSRILVTTIYGHHHKKPIVEITFPKPAPDRPKQLQRTVQLSIDEARDLAMNILQAAESAIQDAFIVEFMSEILGDDRQAAAVLVAFRERRHDRQDDPTA